MGGWGAQGDLTDLEDVKKACKGADCVWHIGALVGPYHPYEMYEKVNYHGTLNVVEACKLLKKRKLNHIRIVGDSTSRRLYFALRALISGWKEADATMAAGHGDDDERFYDRQQAYVHARGG